MIVRSSWRIVAIVALVVVCVVVAVTVSLVAHGSSSSKSDGGGSDRRDASGMSVRAALLIDEPLVVTDVRIVQNATEDGARTQCHNATSSGSGVGEWLVAGKNLNTTTAFLTTTATTDGAFTFLCMRQARIRSVPTTNGSVVLQSLRVVIGAACPLPLTPVFRPRPNVVICSQSIDASVALATGTYVTDIMTTRDRMYSEDAPGASTEDGNIETTPESGGAFLSYKRPVRPIVSTRVLRGVDENKTSTICRSQLGDTWESAGTSLRDVSTNASSRAVLCLERAVLNASDSGIELPKLLVDVALLSPTSDCTSERQELSSNWTVCTKYSSSAAAEAFIGELRLKEVYASSTVAALTPQGTSPIGFRGQAIGTSGGGATVVALYRKQSIVEVEPEVLPTSTSEARSALVARSIDAQSNPNATERLTYKIVQLADLHLTGDASFKCRTPPQEMLDRGYQCTEADTTAFVEQVLDAEKPDFVVFSGDNVEVLDKKRLEDALDAAFGPVEKRQIPYAVVFGNHDDENGQTRQDLANRIIKRTYSYMQWGPTSLDGVGNYQLSVEAPRDGPWGPTGSRVFQMYFLDSHAYGNAGKYPNIQTNYDWIKTSQVEYYKAMARANRDKSNATIVPAVMFFHIPIPEFNGVSPVANRTGEKRERIGGSEITPNLFSAMVEMGDVKATFVGHNHGNEFCFRRQGVQLCYAGGMGFAQAYGYSNFARRSRVIEWSIDDKNKRQIRSWKRHAGSAFATRQTEEVLYEEA